MKHLTHIGSGYPVNELVEELRAHPELWGKRPERVSGYQTPHRDVTDIWMRYNDITKYPEGTDLATLSQPHESVWYSSSDVLPKVKAAVFDVMRRVQGEHLGGVLITKIPPGCEVKPHIDTGWHAGYYEKFALQIEATMGQAFHYADGEFVSMPGDLFWFDNSFEHWVTNDSPIDRITMIVCIRRSNSHEIQH